MKEMKNTRMCCQRDHQLHIPTFVSPSSWQCPPLCGQQVVSEGVQLVKTGGAKQAVRDKRRWTRYAQRPSTHTALSPGWVLGRTLDAPGFIILDRTADDTLVHFKQRSLHCRRLLKHGLANICCYQALHLILILRLIKSSALKRVSESQGAKHNPLGTLIACIWSHVI